MDVTQQKSVDQTAIQEGEVVFLRSAKEVGRLSYHFVGIGGSGMSGLAEMLHSRGYKVSGSDRIESETTKKLRRRGVKVNIGHDESYLDDIMNCLVVSAAVQADNPELKWAQERGILVRKYAEMLGEFSRQIDTIAIAGTHGKSTTTAWLAYTLYQADRDPSYVIGAEVEQLGGTSGAGLGKQLVVESCEYDRSFLNLHPWAAAILNIEIDHLDYYQDLAEIIGVFSEFSGRVTPNGLIVANGGDMNVLEALAGYQGRCEYFSTNGAAQWQVGDLEYHKGHGVFDLIYEGHNLGRVTLSMAGEHNVANALAVAALAHEAGLNSNEICAGLEGFAGAGRRMSYRGETGGVIILDDYAHHPTEIKVTLAAIRAKYEPKRLWCVFQPHQHSRTRFLLQEFAGSFGDADIILLPEIFFVRDSEKLKREINAEQLAEKIRGQGGQAHYLGDFGTIADYLTKNVKPQDVVVTMGAGDVWKLTDELMDRFRRDC
ncbi:MAG: UDP-N-acetylmuramate--L-alanine ligase [Planctomycetes bacterium]|nr:UDP-N-acetylmuramate--L-alanine ligase [Planctomycetota bacterium]